MIAGSVVVLQVKLIMAFPEKQTQSIVTTCSDRELNLSHSTRYLPADLNYKPIPRVSCEHLTGSLME